MTLPRKSTRIVLMFMAAVASLLWFGNNPTDQIDFFTVNDNVSNTTTTTDGVLTILYGSNQALDTVDRLVLLTTDSGDQYEVETTTDIMPLNGDMVSITGTVLDNDPTSNEDALLLIADSIQPLSADAYTNNTVEGNQKWVNIACRFADMDDEPQPREYFEAIMMNQAPGMDHYWRQSSAGMVNIEGSQAYGWYEFTNDKSYYERAAAVNVGFALRTMLTHCAQAAATDDSVDFSQFAGINVMLNDTFGCCAWGGRMPLNINGKLVTFRTTWLPPWAFTSLHVIAHEMGHGWGLPHSSGPYGKVYDSAWDVMSGGTRMLDFCRVGQSDFGCFQVGTIGIHLDSLGWIPENRVVVVNSGQSGIIALDALTTIQSGIDTLLIKIPVDGSKFYTVEVRNFIGYDRNLPGEAVVIHEVMPGRESPAHVVDADGNGNPNDEGAMWLPGETFEADGIKVTVVNRIGATFIVQIEN